LKRTCDGVNLLILQYLQEAKLLLKEDDELILAVYDYWVDKRLRLKQPLILTVKSDKREVSSGSGTSTTNIGGTGPGGSGGGGSSGGQGGGGQGNQNQSNTSTSPYIAFRRRTEKMQTRKNRKNDEVSYEKMLKLRRDLSQAIVLLEMVKRREKTKKEHLNLTADIFERRYHVGDFDGRIFAEMRAARLSKILQPHRPSFGEQNWFHNSGDMMQITGDMAGTIPRRERHKSNKKRKSSKGSGRSVHNGHSSLAFSSIQPSFLGGQISIGGSGMGTSGMSSDDEYGMLPSQSSDLEDEDDGYFAFKRKRNCQYLRPKLDDYDSDDCGLDTFEESPHKFLRLDDLEVEKEMNPSLSNKLKYSLASLSVPKLRFIGFARRRISRGGRVVLDRASIRDPMAAFHAAQLLSNSDRWGDEFISGTVVSGLNSGSRANSHERLQHFRPLTPPNCRDNWTTNFSNGQSNTLSDTLYNSWLPIHPVKPIIKEQLSPGTLSRHIQRHRSGGGTNVKTVSLDPVTAQNAATAVVTSDYLDIFGSL
jgi:enhancer of polycomb-like protein